MKISTQKLEMLMVEKGLTISALAERTGISRQSLSTIKQRQTCRVGTAMKLCAGLGCTAEDIAPDWRNEP